MNTRQIADVLHIEDLYVDDPDLLMARERRDEIMRIEKGVIETNALFKDVQTLVSDQGELIDNIEANIQQSADNATEGAQSLQEAERLQRGCNIL